MLLIVFTTIGLVFSGNGVRDKFKFLKPSCVTIPQRHMKNSNAFIKFAVTKSYFTHY